MDGRCGSPGESGRMFSVGLKNSLLRCKLFAWVPSSDEFLAAIVAIR